MMNTGMGCRRRGSRVNLGAGTAVAGLRVRNTSKHELAQEPVILVRGYAYHGGRGAINRRISLNINYLPERDQKLRHSS